LLLLLTLLPLGGCTGNYSPNTYAAAAAQQAAPVDRGVIVGVRSVLINANGTVGAVTGGAAGGVTGAQAPGGTLGAAFGAIGGTLIGGLAGSAAEQTVADAKGWEYIVQEPNGHLVSVTQTDKVALPIGLHVLVITGKQARIVPDYTVKVPGAKPAQTPPNLAAAPIYVSPLAPAGGAGAPTPATATHGAPGAAAPGTAMAPPASGSPASGPPASNQSAPNSPAPSPTAAPTASAPWAPAPWSPTAAATSPPAAASTPAPGTSAQP
jgi:outer membrane lipoprotein SlyB